MLCLDFKNILDLPKRSLAPSLKYLPIGLSIENVDKYGMCNFI